MKHVQKLVLIPVERWEKIGDNIPMKEITVKSVPQKNISHQKNQIHQVKQTRMFHFLTPEKRKKATKLFEYLIRYKFFTLNSHGEIIQNGKNIHDSNILELIAHAVQNDSSTPIGMKYFYKTLKKKNIPEKYISNKMGRKIMNKSLYHETLKWRPPGRLNKGHNE